MRPEYHDDRQIWTSALGEGGLTDMALIPESLRDAPFALRITQRAGGRAAIIYRRQADPEGRDRLQRVGDLPPLALQATLPMVREAIRAGRQRLIHNGGNDGNGLMEPGAFKPLDSQWGVRVACYALVTASLRDGERMLLASEHLRHANPDQLAWWLGLLMQRDNVRALRALRILTEAVQ
ncbi:MAG: hypothetical protein GXY79_11135 [Chloroflexi bacterium]|nr:hypothetical protein [Chloroflexota bacterium]